MKPVPDPQPFIASVLSAFDAAQREDQRRLRAYLDAIKSDEPTGAAKPERWGK